MKNPMELTGQRILVTGASSGIGKETAILLSQLGADVVITGRDVERLDLTYNELSQGSHVQIPFDLNDFDGYGELFKQIRNSGEKLTGLVHCAGIAKVIPIKVVSYQNIIETMQVNFISFMELVKHFSKKTNSSGGSIACISAINAHYPQKCMSVYAASKGALEMAVSSLAVELFDKDIRVNSVVAGPIRTEMAQQNEDTLGEESNIVGRQLMTIGEPEDIANMVAYLMSNASKFITGRNVYVDGGRL